MYTGATAANKLMTEFFLALSMVLVLGYSLYKMMALWIK